MVSRRLWVVARVFPSGFLGGLLVPSVKRPSSLCGSL